MDVVTVVWREDTAELTILDGCESPRRTAAALRFAADDFDRQADEAGEDWDYHISEVQERPKLRVIKPDGDA